MSEKTALKRAKGYIMKLILAIINNDDAYSVSAALSKEGFSATKISSTGGFLMSGNTTLLLGVEDDMVSRASDIIAENSKKREQIIPSNIIRGNGIPMTNTKVTVGGATLFILNVEECKHL